MKLGKRQQEILSILSLEWITQRQLAGRLKISQQAVCKSIKKLTEKGIINPVKKEVVKGGGCQNPLLNHVLRLHNQQFHVLLLANSERYMRFANRVFRMDGNTIVLNADSLEVYVTKSFYGADIDAITQESLDYVFILLARLENRLNVLLFKEQSHNISLVRQHYAEIHNEIATDLERRGDKLKIKAQDGRLWLVIDYSKPDGVNLNECETVHPQTAKQDMGGVKAVFDDVRRFYPEFGNYILPSEIRKDLTTLQLFVKELVLQGVKRPEPKSEDKGLSDDKKPSYFG